jgi:hypothetical protein
VLGTAGQANSTNKSLEVPMQQISKTQDRLQKIPVPPGSVIVSHT